MGKKFEIKDGDISDGYHTFDELYEHRVALFIRLCNMAGSCYIRKNHYDGWDAIYILLPEGQVSYHVPVRYRDMLPHDCIEVDGGFYDGHDSSDVLNRLLPLR